MTRRNPSLFWLLPWIYSASFSRVMSGMGTRLVHFPWPVAYHHGKTPNIDLVIPLHLHDNLWGSIATRHDKIIMLLVSEPGTTKVTDER